MTKQIDRRSQILEIAQNDENIRGVFLYGSKVNKEVRPDIYQDFDIYYIAENIDDFDISVFADVGLMFVPSDNYPEIFENEYAYLMLFEDDSRIDLVVCTRETFLQKHANEIPMECLLDKDNNLPKTNLGFSEHYYVKPINEIIFAGTCSEFLWELQNVAKGIKRDELSYTMFIRDIGVRDMLNKIIDAYIEMTNPSATVGTLGKYRKKYLSETQYSTYKMTYLSNNSEDIWKSIFYMLELFEELGTCIASHYGYKYPESEVRYIKDYLIRVRDR